MINKAETVLHMYRSLSQKRSTMPVWEPGFEASQKVATNGNYFPSHERYSVARFPPKKTVRAIPAIMVPSEEALNLPCFPDCFRLNW